MRFTALFCVLGFSVLGIAADKIKSGCQPGDKIPKFGAIGVTGKIKGRKHCPT